MSRHERLKFCRREQDILIYEIHEWKCPTCDKDCRWQGRPQLAHRIAKSLMNYSRFGPEIVDHPLNRVPTCSLKCNDAQNIGFNQGRCREFVEELRMASPEISTHIDNVIRFQNLPDLPGGAA